MDMLKINIQKLDRLYLQILKRDEDIAKYEDYLRQPQIPEPTREMYEGGIKRLEEDRISLTQKTISIVYDITSYPYKDLYLTLRSYIKDTYEYDLDSLIQNYSDKYLEGLDLHNEDLESISTSIDEVMKKYIIKNKDDKQLINNELNQAKQSITDNDIAFTNKLKLTIPIIPFLLSYQAELSLNNKVKLNALWAKFKNKKG
jgi:hypothetical protein